MLQSMQQPGPTQPSPAASSFAGLLATLASPKPAAAEDEALWSASDLGEDVASLSYERALRAHARYRAAHRGDDRDVDLGGEMPMPPAGSEPAAMDAAIRADIPGADDAVAAALSLLSEAVPDRDLRSASVTIRLSKAECARLRDRAAEAGLTVSAYLRSCALEAEVLRAQVKQALAEIKAGTEGPRDQGNKAASQCGSEGVKLTRVFGRIGKVCVGLASRKPS